MTSTSQAITDQPQTTPLPSLQSDPWTPDQELNLLKALVKFKPVGLHAHFRMLSIHAFLQASGTCTAEDEHTRIPGIWAKLRTLYDLERLDEREDAVLTGSGTGNVGGDDDATTTATGGSEKSVVGTGYWRDFELPRDDGMGGDFERLMWERRLAPEGTPGVEDGGEEGWRGGGAVGRGRGTRRESTVAGTDEPRSSPVASSVNRGTRGGRRGGGRVSRLKGEAEASEGRRSRRESRTASEVGTKDEDGDENMEDAEDGEESAEGEEDEEESSEEHEEHEKRGPARRGRGGRRGRGRRGRRRG